ncbi:MULTISPECIES: deoxyribose-phosphate aldolase [Methylorubrum]|uniref:deoxyribose-phosphate aldolase n=1 Tax=Methylorubrum TaxID=2282523 RepID=UPI00209E0DF2|nr:MULTISPECIES: deoxyribose-phosphate aldolase [Methylorubrum]MCP1548850.1 deoxyribose-phosphate aldolase [Methylorubrum zatmanii]MCP1554537.1 deoxyribose-phosphate aldolase [Methylorubrum extorquens]MCP1579153.1 deoxyribose-phosphate aldolase [Methylorubrum extorquens]
MTASAPLPPQDAARVARRALPLLDLTDLSDACTAASIEDLCGRARSSGVAAVCVWPRFVADSVRALRASGVRVATVVNFPEGGEAVARTVAETQATLADGADEIDLVLPYRALMRGDVESARAMVEAVRAACAGRLLKVILETGELEDPDLIAQASRLSLEAGADFIKTSTGKTAVSATLPAAEIMLGTIRARSGRAVGLKVSGGLRRVEDAAAYLALADGIMGPDWVSPTTFRIGASALHAELVRAGEDAR